MTTHEKADLQRLSPGVQCSARSVTTGQRCKRWAIRGGTVCPKHGGSAPQVVAAAKKRLQAMADAAAGRLGHFAFDDGVAENTALAATNSILDRAGLSPKQAVEVEIGLKPWEQVLQGVAGVARVSQADSRRARGLPVDDETPMPALEPVTADTVIDAEVVDENPDAPSAYPTPAPSGTHKPPWRRPPYGPGADEPIIPPTGSPASKALVTIEEAEAAERQRQYAEAARRERERASTGRIARRAR